MGFKVLVLTTSARPASSTTTQALERAAQLLADHPGAQLQRRDLGLQPLPLIDADWVEGAALQPAERTPAQASALALSDMLIDELLAADAVVIGLPIYNFSVPTALKAWIDQVVREGCTFAHDGPGRFRGLLPAGRTVHLALGSGRLGAGTDAEQAVAYLRRVLGFIGLSVGVVTAVRPLAAAV